MAMHVYALNVLTVGNVAQSFEYERAPFCLLCVICLLSN